MVQLIRKGWNQRSSERSSVVSSSRPSIALSTTSRTSNAYASFDSDELNVEEKTTSRAESSLQLVGTAFTRDAKKKIQKKKKNDDSDEYDYDDVDGNNNATTNNPPPFKRTISTTYPLQRYYELAKQMKEEIEVKDRKPTTNKRTSIMIKTSNKTTYQQCFLGSDAVGFIQNYLHLNSREKAVEIGNEMNKRIHCWESVGGSGDDELKDKISSFFRFTDTSKSQEARLKGLIQRRSVATTETTSSSVVSDGDTTNSQPDNNNLSAGDNKTPKEEEKVKPSKEKNKLDDTPQPAKEETQHNDAAESRKTTRGSRKIRSQSPRREKSNSNTPNRKTRSLSPRKDGFPSNSPRKGVEGDINKSSSDENKQRMARVSRKDRSKSPVRRAASGDTTDNNNNKKMNEERRKQRNDAKVSKSVQERCSPSGTNRAMRKTISMPEAQKSSSPTRSTSHHHSSKKEQAKKYLEQAHASWGIESEEFAIIPPTTDTTNNKPGRMASLGVLAIASLESRAGTSVINSLGKAAAASLKEGEEEKKNPSSKETALLLHGRPSLSEEARPCLATKEGRRTASLGALAMTSSPDSRARSASPTPKTPQQQSKKATRLASLYSSPK